MIKVGVVGAGHLGVIHIKLLMTIQDFNLVGFHDSDKGQATHVQEQFGLNYYSDVDELLDLVDVIDIVTPTLTHFDYAKKSLLKGKHVFIEKPVTTTVNQAEELIKIASTQSLKVQVGHVERFNPAFTAAKPFINKPLFIETHRLAKFNPRGTDVSVVLDLMIHDIDIILNIVNSEVIHVSTSGVAVASNTPDITNARIEFENGAVANLTASRVSLKNMRKTRIFQKDAYVAIDFLDKKTEIVHLGEAQRWNPLAYNIQVDSNGTKKSVHLKKPKIKDVNAIQEELRNFARSIIDNKDPLVTLNEGCEALRIAHIIIDKVNDRIVKTLSNV